MKEVGKKLIKERNSNERKKARKKTRHNEKRAKQS